jgi:protein-tyrosine phosphatase
VIDLHCHVLAGVDDGPANLQESLELARVATTAGVTTLVATPHVSSRYMNGSEVIRDAVTALRDALAAARIELELRAGAEIAIARLGELSDDELRALRLGDGPWLLIEAPLTPAAGGLEAVLGGLRRRGQEIVLAHPERSPIFLRDPRRLSAIVAEGILCSITASSLVGAFGREVQSFALALARDGLVHNVASDAHDAVRRPPVIRSDIIAASARVRELSARVEWLTDEMPRAILAGEALPSQPGGFDTARRRGLARLRWRPRCD